MSRITAANTLTMAEKIDVLDECGLRTGKMLSKQEIHALGKLHRAVHLYLFDQANKLLLQRRSDHTDHIIQGNAAYQ